MTPPNYKQLNLCLTIEDFDRIAAVAGNRKPGAVGRELLLKALADLPAAPDQQGLPEPTSAHADTKETEQLNFRISKREDAELLALAREKGRARTGLMIWRMGLAAAGGKPPRTDTEKLADAIAALKKSIDERILGTQPVAPVVDLAPIAAALASTTSDLKRTRRLITLGIAVACVVSLISPLIYM